MEEILLAFVLASCPQTQMINKSTLPWNAYDKQEMAYAKKRCSEIYDDAPCLKRFFKLGFQDYYAECGKP